MQNPWSELGNRYEEEISEIQITDDTINTTQSTEEVVDISTPSITQEILENHHFDYECCYCKCEARCEEDDRSFYKKEDPSVIVTFVICERCEFLQVIKELPWISEIDRDDDFTDTISMNNYFVLNWENFIEFMNKSTK